MLWPLARRMREKGQLRKLSKKQIIPISIDIKNKKSERSRFAMCCDKKMKKVKNDNESCNCMLKCIMYFELNKEGQ
jgi:hypothetical protein